jgi:hypothetical protein
LLRRERSLEKRLHADPPQISDEQDTCNTQERRCYQSRKIAAREDCQSRMRDAVSDRCNGKKPEQQARSR